MQRIDDRATLKRLDDSFEFHFAGARFDRHFSTRGDVTTLFETTRYAEAARCRSRLSLPIETCYRRFQHCAQTFVLDVLQTKLDRIHLHECGELINMDLARKVIRSRGESAR